jgi:hypothetical protein
MQGKMIDIIEDMEKGINTEQLAPKPAEKEDNNDDK